jgi:hypothetical protein
VGRVASALPPPCDVRLTSGGGGKSQYDSAGVSTSSVTTGTHEAVIHEPHVMDRSPRYSAASLADSRLNGVPVSTSAELAALDWYCDRVRKRPRDAPGSIVRVVSVAVAAEEVEVEMGGGESEDMGGPAIELMSGAKTAPRADLLGTAHDRSVSPSTCHHITDAELGVSTRAVHADYVGQRARKSAQLPQGKSTYPEPCQKRRPKAEI